jgi:hypothetical protein
MKLRRPRAIAATALALLLLAPGYLAAQEEIIPYSRYSRAPSNSRAWIGIRGFEFLPGDETLREVYGTGGMAFGLTAGIDLHRWGGFGLAAEIDAGRFHRTGASTLSNTSALLTLVPISVSIQARLETGPAAFWLEGGGKLVFYSEDSELAASRGSAFGFLAGGGAELALRSGPAMQVFFRWSQADERMEGFTVHLGGWEIGASILYRFGI